jgi:AcrR family transcriptional regulator
MKVATENAMKAKRRRLDPQRREEEIVEAAIRYFSEVGFAGSMRELAGRLGISHALLFRYFDTKDALIDRVYERTYLGRWKADWDAMLASSDLAFADRLITFYTSYLEAIDRPEWVRMFMFGGLSGVNINQRYLKLIARKVIVPVALDLRQLTGSPAPKSGEPSEAELELSWGLHGEIFYLAIRRWIYGLKVTTDRSAFVKRTVTQFLEGAPAALKATRART